MEYSYSNLIHYGEIIEQYDYESGGSIVTVKYIHLKETAANHGKLFKILMFNGTVLEIHEL